MKKSLFDKACETSMQSRFVARADDLNRDLTDEEVIAEAEYQLESIPYIGLEKAEERKAIREMKRLLKG